MTKVYLLNQEKNNATFILYGEGGNMVRYTFKDGNAGARVAASCMLNNEYYQNLLEKSEVFEKGIVKLDPTYKYVAPKKVEKKLIEVPEVKSVAQAVDYCAEKWGEVAKTARQAKIVAERNGYDFVNLKVKD